MPWGWYPPDEFMSEKATGDVPVYYCYKGGCLMDFHYQIESDHFDSGWMEFDIRDLAREACPGMLPAATMNRESHGLVIQLAAIELALEAWLTETGIGREGETGDG